MLKNKIDMKKINFFMILILMLVIFMPQPAQGALTHTIRVKWKGIDFRDLDDCGDGGENQCEGYFKVLFRWNSDCTGPDQTGVSAATDTNVLDREDYTTVHYTTWSVTDVYSTMCSEITIQFFESEPGTDDTWSYQYFYEITDTSEPGSPSLTPLTDYLADRKEPNTGRFYFMLYIWETIAM